MCVCVCILLILPHIRDIITLDKDATLKRHSIQYGHICTRLSSLISHHCHLYTYKWLSHALISTAYPEQTSNGSLIHTVPCAPRNRRWLVLDVRNRRGIEGRASILWRSGQCHMGRHTRTRGWSTHVCGDQRSDSRPSHCIPVLPVLHAVAQRPCHAIHAVARSVDGRRRYWGCDCEIWDARCLLVLISFTTLA